MGIVDDGRIIEMPEEIAKKEDLTNEIKEFYMRIGKIRKKYPDTYKVLATVYSSELERMLSFYNEFYRNVKKDVEFAVKENLIDECRIVDKITLNNPAWNYQNNFSFYRYFNNNMYFAGYNGNTYLPYDQDSGKMASKFIANNREELNELKDIINTRRDLVTGDYGQFGMPVSMIIGDEIMRLGSMFPLIQEYDFKRAKRIIKRGKTSIFDSII